MGHNVKEEPHQLSTKAQATKVDEDKIRVQDKAKPYKYVCTEQASLKEVSPGGIEDDE